MQEFLTGAEIRSLVSVPAVSLIGTKYTSSLSGQYTAKNSISPTYDFFLYPPALLQELNSTVPFFNLPVLHCTLKNFPFLSRTRSYLWLPPFGFAY